MRDIAAMDRAITLALAGLGSTSPNPCVGAVILDASGTLVGEGHTEPAGGAHAEIVALRQAGDRASGGTAVVTLEPCNHTGRTGPCTEALIAAGIGRVVAAVREPTPRASGGIERLRSAGVDTEQGVRETEARHGLRYWLTAIGRGRPYVIWKYAATLDGRSAAADGTSKWITSEEARSDVHALRGTVDAIIAGIGTILADDAHLTVRPTPSIMGLVARHAGEQVTNSRIDGVVGGGAVGGGGVVGDRAVGGGVLRVVVDSGGRTPKGSRVCDDAAPTWIATAADVGTTADGRVDLDALLKRLYARGVRAALLEGGPTLAGAFLAAGLVDEVVGYVAPKLLGAGASALADAGVGTIADAIDLRITDVTRIGPDLRFTAVPAGGDN